MPLSERRRIADRHADPASTEVGNAVFEPGDEWVHAETKVPVDLMCRRIAWIEAQIARVMDRHEASLGYATCLCHNIAPSVVLFDCDDWLTRLQNKERHPYPEPLRRAILAKDLPLLATTRASYAAQILNAVKRGDRVAVNHRLDAFLASYFDCLFAANRRLHPGEKRLLLQAEASDLRLPSEMTSMIEHLLTAADRLPMAKVDELIRSLPGGLARLASDLDWL